MNASINLRWVEEARAYYIVDVSVPGEYLIAEVRDSAYADAICEFLREKVIIVKAPQ